MRTGTAVQRHDFDPIAFLFGLLFTGSGVLFMIGRFDLFNHARWLWPGLLVLLGIAVLVGARGRGSLARDRPLGAGPAPTAGPAHDASDLDAIEPPIGPEAFRLPGWPAPDERQGAEELPPQPDPHSQTEIIAKVDPEAETQVLRERPPEPPPR